MRDNQERLTLGSLFDGIGGWLLAAKHNNIKPLWGSEIDEYPAAVTAYHFPEVKQYGDITKINGAELEPVDILCAGSPCQDLSVAGARKGLNGSRSNLFYEAIRVMREMKEATNGEYPKYFVWENVPGAFSSNRGQDFRAVLSEIGEAPVPMPRNGRWANAGLAELPDCQIAWRTLDAQYFGVPQRRRRIFLVADFATTDRRAGEILFERKSLSGDSSESEENRDEDAADTGTSVDGASSVGLDLYNRSVTGDKACTVTTKTGRYADASGPSVMVRLRVEKPSGENDQTLITCYNMGQPSNGFEPYTAGGGVSPTLVSRMGTGGNQVPVVHSTVNYQKTVGALCACDCKGAGNQFVKEGKVIVQGMVRRLTPTECERLQGLSDGYTDIIFNGKPAADSRRYKALGNGMAQPCADFVIRRIREQHE